MQEIFYESGKDTLYAVVEGEGLPVIYYHGAFGTHEQVWLKLHQLADKYTFIAPDARGRGRSICVDADCYTWKQYARDVTSLLDYLGIERAVIGGGSFGAGVALAAGLQHPDRFDALVLQAPIFMGNELGYLPKQRAARAVHWWRSALQKVQQGEFGAVVAEHAARFHDAETRAQERHKWASHDPSSFAAFISTTLLPWGSAGHPFDHLSELKALTMPVLVIPGDDDVHAREVSDAYMRVLPNARRTQFEGAEVDQADVLLESSRPTKHELAGVHLTKILRAFLSEVAD